jgi:preprotein translocase subunit SecD
MRRHYITLLFIFLLVGLVIWFNLPGFPGIKIGDFYRSMQTVLGLDLRGGVEVLLEADLPATTAVDASSLNDARSILENRTNALGVSENLFQVAGDRRIVGEFPGLDDPARVIAVIKETGLLEFADLGDTYLPDGTVIQTDFGASTTQTNATTPTAIPSTPTTAAPTATSAPGTTPTPAATPTSPAVVYHTIMTGKELKSVGVSVDSSAGGGYQINFVLSDAGSKIFSDYTNKSVNKFLAIVLDKKIVSAPRIQTPITDGQGRITGTFTNDQANNLAIQMRYGALPIPFKVVESRVIGPTLGQDSLNKSLIAGLIGITIVFLFMGIYYRVPGISADLSIIIYALITLALFKLIPVTLTLPGIAGFLLGTGSALDANILIFERLKEELRAGRTYVQAIDLAWKRAWPSIRDSNAATLITCMILWWFGSSFGATIVKGFAFTLVIGVFVSLFCAYFVTLTFLHVIIDRLNPDNKFLKWFGVVD